MGKQELDRTGLPYERQKWEKWWDEDKKRRLPDRRQSQGIGGAPIRERLNLFDGNCAFLTNLDTTLASKTFFSIDGHGFAVLHLKYLNRTDIHALFAASTFVFINGRIKSHYSTLLSMNYFAMVVRPSTVSLAGI
jgi:hypothetical protein